MKISEDHLKILFLHLHKKIEEIADQAASGITDKSREDIVIFPPNGGLNEQEKEAINSIYKNDFFLSALRKIIADASYAIVFELFSLIDGVIDPDFDGGKWRGLRMVDESENLDTKNSDFLHDRLFESYWDWMEVREKKDRKLDNLK